MKLKLINGLHEKKVKNMKLSRGPSTFDDSTALSFLAHDIKMNNKKKIWNPED